MADRPDHTLTLHVCATVSTCIEEIGLGQTPDDARAALIASYPAEIDIDEHLGLYGVTFAITGERTDLQRFAMALPSDRVSMPSWLGGGE